MKRRMNWTVETRCLSREWREATTNVEREMPCARLPFHLGMEQVGEGRLWLGRRRMPWTDDRSGRREIMLTTSVPATWSRMTSSSISRLELDVFHRKRSLFLRTCIAHPAPRSHHSPAVSSSSASVQGVSTLRASTFTTHSAIFTLDSLLSEASNARATRLVVSARSETSSWTAFGQ